MDQRWAFGGGLFGVLVGVGIYALSGSAPSGLGDHAAEYIAPQGVHRAITKPLGTGTSPLGAIGGSARLLEWGSLVVLKNLSTSDSMTCALVVSASVALGTPEASDQCTITTTISGGVTLTDGPCLSISAGEAVNQVVEYDDAESSIPLRSRGVCASTVRAWTGGDCYVRCRSNNDCSELGAGSTCTIAPTSTDVSHFRDQGCGLYVCRPKSSGVPANLRFED